MAVLSGLKPESVFKYFEEICGIPHGSGDTKRISDYLVDFALDHGLINIQDDSNNVIIYKEGQLGGEESEPIILQGHMDMVCEKTADTIIDFHTEGLRLKVENNIISAVGTTLGGDDGIAVAYMLALLESSDIPHPPLECVFTVDEEIGMLGAAALDMSYLRGRKLLNIDSEDEGYLLVSCAGGATVTIHFPFTRRGAQGKAYKINVCGLLGGHSGIEIDKGRANADIILCKVLKELLFSDDSLRILSVKGGLKDNAIPVQAEAEIVSKNFDILSDNLKQLEKQIKSEFSETDPDISITIEETVREDFSIYPVDEADNLSIIMALSSMPFGIKAMSRDIEGLVQTSQNLGILYTTDNEIILSYSVRSSVAAEKKEMITELETIARSAGGYIEVSGDYPAWEYKSDSQLRDIMTETFEEMYNKPMIVQAIHAGVECGLFAGALDGLDAVSFGPDMLDIHTPKERMDVASVSRTWEYLLKVLEKLL